MSRTIALDTSAAIQLFRRDTEAVRAVQEYEDVVIPLPAYAELLRGQRHSLTSHPHEAAAMLD